LVSVIWKLEIAPSKPAILVPIILAFSFRQNQLPSLRPCFPSNAQPEYKLYHYKFCVASHILPNVFWFQILFHQIHEPERQKLIGESSHYRSCNSRIAATRSFSQVNNQIFELEKAIQCFIKFCNEISIS
jgi:hypothetical protein